MSRRVGWLAVAIATAMTWFAAPAAMAEGTETLGVPNIPISSGSASLIAGVGTQQYPDAPVSFTFQVPAGATVKQVLAYWHGHATSGPGSVDPDKQISLNGTSVTGQLIGGPSNFYLGELFWTYRADVTSLNLAKAGSNSVTVSDMNFVSGILAPSGNEGAALVIIYDLPGSSKLVGLRDGSDIAWAGATGAYKTTVPQTFTFASAATPRPASLGVLVGSAYSPDATGVWGNVVKGTFNTGETFSIVNTLQANQGYELDAANLPVTIPPNATSVTIEIVSEGGDLPGSVTWTAATLSIEGGTTPPTEQPCVPGADNSKWTAWINWWKTYLAAKFGQKYADKFASYFSGGDCSSGDGDGCTVKRSTFGFYWHRSDCAPPPDSCRNPKTLVELIKFLIWRNEWCRH